MGRLEKHLSSKNNPIRKTSGGPQISHTMVQVKLGLNSLFCGELIKSLYTHARFIPFYLRTCFRVATGQVILWYWGSLLNKLFLWYFDRIVFQYSKNFTRYVQWLTLKLHIENTALYSARAENTIICFQLPFGWYFIETLLLHYFLSFCTNCTCSARAVYATLRRADALHVQIVPRTKHIAKLGFMWSTTQTGM